MNASTTRFAGINIAFVLLIIVLIGGIVRILPLGNSPYPLNDGGLFAHMATDLTGNAFRLPAFTTYNGEAIPFAYPPLGIYLTAAISLLSGTGASDVLHWLPAVLSTATILAVYFMAAELLRSRWRGVVTAAAFALMPRSYLWLVVGGGVTRSLGLLLALLALQQGLRMLRTHRSGYVVTTGVLGGLTVQSHPQAALFLAVSLVTLVGFHAYRGRLARATVQLILAGLVGLLVSAPWAIAVAAEHGIGPLISAGQTALDPTVGAGQLLGLAFTDGPVLDVITGLGILGLVVRIARGQLMIPTWLALTVLIDPRAGATFATIPLALSVVPIIGELLQRMVPAQGGTTTLGSDPMPRVVRAHRAASIVIVLLLFVALRTTARTAVDPASPLHGLSSEHVQAMKWISDNVSDDVQFAVIADRSWEADYLSEWFPVISQRTSIATVQGSEWTGLSSFLRQLAVYRQLQACARQTASCIHTWSTGWDVSDAYVFVPKGRLFGPSSPADCCPALRETLSASTDFDVIYDGPGATVFAPAIR